MPVPIFLIKRDQVFGFYAHVPPRHTEAVEDAFTTDEKYFADINIDAAKRLQLEGFDLVVFRTLHQKHILKKLRAIDWAPELPPEFGAHDAPRYAPPLDRFLTRGDPGHFADSMPPAFYQALGATPGDIPEIIHMFKDPEIQHMDADGGYSPACWAFSHAQRALVELRAPGAAQLLIDHFYAEAIAREENSYFLPSIEDCDSLLRALGEDAVDIIIENIEANGDNADLGGMLSEALAGIIEKHPARRDKSIAAIVGRLKQHHANRDTYNGLLISSLLDLRAVEAAPVIEEAYAANNVDCDICGDWDDVKFDLGMATHRDGSPLLPPDPAIEERRRSILQNRVKIKPPKIGRNEPCPCGSGKKHKKCCIDKPR